jgi:threonine/homoserine/homoserine lactone efflux protein
MLTTAIGELLPSAVAVALSPIPIIAVILMLGTPKARSNGPAFAAGWVLGLAVVSGIVLAVAGGADDPDSATSSGVDWGTLVIGLLFLAMAAKQWQQRPKAGEEATMPSWMASVDHFTAGRSFVLGVALSGVNPKNLALTVTAMASVAQLGLSTGDEVAAVAVFVVLASVTVAGSVLFYLVDTDRATRALAPVKTFMADHNAVIMMVILLILGAKLIGNGLAGVAD